MLKIDYSSQYDKFLVESISRIIREYTCVSVERLDEFEKEIRHNIAHASGRHEYALQLSNIVADLTAKKQRNLNGIVTLAHIRNVSRILEKIPEDLPEVKTYSLNYFETSAWSDVMERLDTLGTGNTVISYHDYETVGPEAIVSELIAAGYNEPTVEVRKLDKPEDSMEKDSMFGIKSWIYVPMLPVIVITVKD